MQLGEVNRSHNKHCLHVTAEEPHPAVKVVDEAGDQDKGVVLRADLRQAPALPHGNAVIGGIVAHPCQISICSGSTG